MSPLGDKEGAQLGVVVATPVLSMDGGFLGRQRSRVPPPGRRAWAPYPTFGNSACHSPALQTCSNYSASLSPFPKVQNVPKAFLLA